MLTLIIGAVATSASVVSVAYTYATRVRFPRKVEVTREVRVEVPAPKQDYNGWDNYETWAVNLWLSNDQGLYDYVTEAAEREWRDADGDMDDYRYALAAWLKDFVSDDELECLGTNTEGAQLSGKLGSDLMSAALSEVNWHEVAENWEDSPAERWPLDDEDEDEDDAE